MSPTRLELLKDGEVGGNAPKFYETRTFIAAHGK
jgi:hypothetical protein